METAYLSDGVTLLMNMAEETQLSSSQCLQFLGIQMVSLDGFCKFPGLLFALKVLAGCIQPVMAESFE